MARRGNSTGVLQSTGSQWSISFLEVAYPNFWRMVVMYKQLLLAVALCGMFPVSGAERASVGQPLPPINAVDENNAVVPLNQFKDKMGVVIFFFPKAFTGGCVCEN